MFLPSGILAYFDLVNHVSWATCFILFLEEKPSIPEKYSHLHLYSKGFFPEIEVQDFPFAARQYIFISNVIVGKILKLVRPIVTIGKEARAKRESYEPEVFSNGDTLRQLLARSRYLLFKVPGKWTDSQKRRAGILFKQFPDIKAVCYYALRWGKIFTDYIDKDVACAKNLEVGVKNRTFIMEVCCI